MSVSHTVSRPSLSPLFIFGHKRRLLHGALFLFALNVRVRVYTHVCTYICTHIDGSFFLHIYIHKILYIYIYIY